MAKKTAITPTRQEDYAEWYQQVVKGADLAENSPVRGCMIIKPWGCSLWENMQRVLDKMFKDTGHKNAYFPLFLPLSFLSKEAKHVEGFAKECAVVTHHRLESDGNGNLVPAGKLEEPLIVRPTSETIIGEAFAKWVNSYRDLPLLINQWANVVRWEMRTRLFLRTSEFLWQEGHTVHATAECAKAETARMLDIYADFMENYLAMPVVKGRKTDWERFPGADDTLTCEAMMQDKKALQAGTSHFLGQNFAKAANIQFLNKDGTQKTAFTTSWGVSTRMIGGLIMTHSDDDGLVLPPRIAPSHLVILPFLKGNEADEALLEFCKTLKARLSEKAYFGRVIEVELDTRDIGNGPKKWDWVRKGIPLRVEIGAKELEAGTLSLQRRDEPGNVRHNITADALVEQIVPMLDEIQDGLLNKAKAFRTANTKTITSKEDFYNFFKGEQGGFAICHWANTEELEAQLKKDLQVTTRCIPLDWEEEAGTCIFTGEATTHRVIFAKAY